MLYDAVDRAEAEAEVKKRVFVEEREPVSTDGPGGLSPLLGEELCHRVETIHGAIRPDEDLLAQTSLRVPDGDDDCLGPRGAGRRHGEALLQVSPAGPA
jgi:hypothetical protein